MMEWRWRPEERFLPFLSSSSPRNKEERGVPPQRVVLFSCVFSAVDFVQRRFTEYVDVIFSLRVGSFRPRQRVFHPTRYRHRHPPRRDLRGSLPWLGESPPMQREGPGQSQYFLLGVDGAVRVKSVSPFSLSLSSTWKIEHGAPPRSAFDWGSSSPSSSSSPCPPNGGSHAALGAFSSLSPHSWTT